MCVKKENYLNFIMQIGYGILLDDRVGNFMREVELQLFEKFGIQKGLHQPPHITVKPPFAVSETDPYKNYLEELCRKIEPFEIELKGFNSFGNKVIYLDVKDDKRLHQIYETIFLDLQRKFNIVPPKEEMIFHATLGYGDLTPEIFNKAIDYLRSNFQPEFKFKFEKIGLFYQLPEDSGWIVIKKQKLH